MAISYVYVTCANCGAEVDRVEYDADTRAPAVQSVMDTLGLDEAAAVKLVKRERPGAERSSEENARALASDIATQDAELERTPDSYACPAGHDAGLVVTDDNPTPVVTVRLAKVPA